ncbi:Clp protease subunit [Vibrio phage BONAISHI]|nr:Clp protease subunit [Vibrio phage BONAISHI]
MKHIVYSSPAGLDMEIMTAMAEGEKVFLIDFFNMCGNPHDALEIHDDLEAYKRTGQATFHVRLRGLTSVFNLAAVSAADKIWVNKHNNALMHPVESFGYGSASDLFRAATHNEDLTAKIAGIVTDRFGLEDKKVREMMKEGVFITGEQSSMFNGIDVITDLLETIPRGTIELPEDQDKLKRQHSGIEGEG